jgi:hypothetical protein
MGGRVATNEDSGEVFLRGSISGFRGRSYSALQELDSSPFLPGGCSRTLARYGQLFNYRIRRGLLRNWTRPTSEEV